MEKPKPTGAKSSRTTPPTPSQPEAKPTKAQPTPTPTPKKAAPTSAAKPAPAPTPAPAPAKAPAQPAPSPAPKPAAKAAAPKPSLATPTSASASKPAPTPTPAPTPVAAKAPAQPAPNPAPKPAAKAAAPTPPVATPTSASASKPVPAAKPAPTPTPAPTSVAAKAQVQPAPSPAPKPAAKAAAPKPPVAPPTSPSASKPATAAKPAPAPTPASAPAKAPVTPAKAAAPAPKTPPASPAPSILLEDDSSRVPAGGGPGDRYVLGVGARPATGLPLAPGELPSAYGTGRLLLLARDPHWIYAHWDLTDAQLREYNRKSADGHLVLRVYAGSTPTASPLVEQGVHPESRNWFLHVPTAGAVYLAELGYRGPRKSWTRISLSAATLTPTEELSTETWVRFETLPFDVPMTTLVQLVREALPGHAPLIEAIAELRARGNPELPSPATIAAGTWTPEQEYALAQVLNMDEVRRIWIGSLEITELLRRQLVRGLSSGELPVGGPRAVSSITSLSSPFGGAAPGARGFWFNVNAELIVYGATDPQATVRIGDRTIRLRPDGTFSYRFSLPDGNYALPIRATSPDGVETRSAELAFERTSQYQGDVGTHPQDPVLRTPSPAHVG